MDTVVGLRVIVADSDDDHRLALVKLLSVLPAVAEVHSAPDALGALRLLHDIPADVLFVQVELPLVDGFELARIVQRFAAPPPVVFVADDGGRALEAFDVGAVDFVCRTAGSERLAESLRRLDRFRTTRAAAAPPPVALAAGVAGVAGVVGPVAVDVLDGDRDRVGSAVRWLESDGNYVRVHTGAKSELLRGPLAARVADWEQAGVVRIHRSYAVRLGAVSEFRRFGDGYTVVVDGRELPVARRAVRLLKERLAARAGSTRRRFGGGSATAAAA